MSMVDETQARWASLEGVLVAGEVLARLKAERPVGDLGLGEVNGWVDLRGFPPRPPRPVSRDDVRKWRSGKQNDHTYS
jgi:hypothetical protein